MLLLSLNKSFILLQTERLNIMQVFTTVQEIQFFLNATNPNSIGFVPTMGALHPAHISLIDISKAENEITICSIFVNPKQFNKKKDLELYPRNTASDLAKLAAANCDVIFIPSVEEMYPFAEIKEFHFGVLSEVMEAAHRPGHFNGVAIVIERFFEILTPTNAYFGEKDFQQLAVVRALAEQINSPVNIVGCPIYREASGLALSSRNERLTADEKVVASEISKALTFVRSHKKTHSIAALKDYFGGEIKKHPLLKLEYFEIADQATLTPLTEWNKAEGQIAFTAVNLNGVRLIDNMTIIN
jgi:pantoate--beta-alanine ligase